MFPPVRLRWWVAALIALVVIAVAWLWWAGRASALLPLTVVNGMAQPVVVTFYGEGLAERTYLASLTAGARMELKLQREATGPLRLRVVHSRADIDALLVADVAALQGPQQLQLAPGNRYLLQPLAP